MAFDALLFLSDLMHGNKEWRAFCGRTSASMKLYLAQDWAVYLFIFFLLFSFFLKGKKPQINCLCPFCDPQSVFELREASFSG